MPRRGSTAREFDPSPRQCRTGDARPRTTCRRSPLRPAAHRRSQTCGRRYRTARAAGGFEHFQDDDGVIPEPDDLTDDAFDMGASVQKDRRARQAAAKWLAADRPAYDPRRQDEPVGDLFLARIENVDGRDAALREA